MLSLHRLLRPFRIRDTAVPLQQAIEHGGPLSALQVDALLEAVLAALAPLHDSGLAMGDLKASRILLGHPMRVLIDEKGPPMPMEIDVLEGAPHYLAPERILHGEVTPATDMYALGALLHYATTGRHAFEGNNPIEICEGHLYRDLPVLCGRHARVIALMMSKDPRARPTLFQLVPRVAA